MKKQRKRITKPETSEVVLSKREQTKLDKLTRNWKAFMMRYKPPFYVSPAQVEDLIPKLIIDRERQPQFLIHHKINFGGCVKVVLGLRDYHAEQEAEAKEGL